MPDTRVSDLLEHRTAPLLSFEFFPPKNERGMQTLRRAAESLLAVRPDFVTVTCGAGGSSQTRTLEVCSFLRELGFQTVIPHITCVGSTRQRLEKEIDRWYADGYRTVMALRGDPPEGHPFTIPHEGLSHGSDLVTLLRTRHDDLCCGVAGYPEVHPESPSEEIDIRYLKEKVMAGASYIVTQLFFESDVYFRFVERCRQAGISIPILPGLLPALSLPQVKRTVMRCQARLPAQLEQKMENAGGVGEAAEAEGIRWAADQIRALLKGGAPGIHLYVLNQARAALAPELARCFAEFHRPLGTRG